MKKFFKGSLILVLIFTFAVGSLAISGCANAPEDDNSKDFPLDRRIGILKSLGGIKTESSGTHLLQLDNGDTILLKSESMNLEDKKYYSQTLEVRGVLTYTKDSKPLMDVLNIDILEVYEDKEEKKVKWVTYESKDLMFSLKYRDDFVIREGARGVTFEIIDEVKSDSDSAENGIDDGSADGDSGESEDDGGDYLRSINIVRIDTDSKGPGQDILSYLNVASEDSADLLDAGLTKSKVGKNSLVAFKEQSMDGAGVTFYLEGGTYFYSISFEGGDEAGFLKAQNLFFEMLGTFEVGDAPMMDDEVSDGEEDENLIDSRVIFDDSVGDEDGGADPFEDLMMEDLSDEASPVEDALPEDSGISADLPDDFVVFENETFDFNIQHPKSWFYEGSASGESGVIRHYEFGDKPLDEEDGDVFLDLMSGDLPSGSQITAGGHTVTKISSGSNVELYVDGGNRIYRITGPASLESTLLQMAGSIE